MTYSAASRALAKSLTSSSAIVKKVTAVAPVSKLVGAQTCKSLPHQKPTLASRNRCQASLASVSKVRPASPVVVPSSSRQAEAIAKHLKRVKSAKAMFGAEQRRYTPSPPPSRAKHTRSLPPKQRVYSPSISVQSDDNLAVDQVAEALASLRVSPVSRVPMSARSRIPRPAAARPQEPTTRSVLRSCLAKKKVVLSSSSCLPRRRRLQKRVNFGPSATRTFPNVRLYVPEVLPVWQAHALLACDEETGIWTRMDDPVEVATKYGQVFAHRLSTFCAGCRSLTAGGGLAEDEKCPRLRCQACLDAMQLLLDGTPDVADVESDFDDSASDDVSFVLDPEPLEDWETGKVTEYVGDSFEQARPSAIDRYGDYSDLVDAEYDFDNDPEIF